jgi:ketosteroid isomerase-like protein
MPEHENVNVVKDAYRAFTENNFDVLRECLDENVKWFALGPPHLIPTAGTRYGIEQVEQYFRLLKLSGLKSFTPLEFIAEEDKVVVIGDQMCDVTSTTLSRRSPWIHVFTLRQGRIWEFRAFYDTAATISAVNANIPTRNTSLRPVLARPAIF